MRAHIVHAYGGKQQPLLTPLLDPALDVTWSESTSDAPNAATIDVLVCGTPQPELIAACTALKALVIPWAGLPGNAARLLAGRPEIAVHNLHHNAGVTAESAFALLLAAAKRVVPMDRAIRVGDWRERYEPGAFTILEGQTLLIAGYGAIGQRLCRMARGFGMKVIAIRRRKSEPVDIEPDEVHGPDALRDVLPRADAVIVVVPGTPQTEGMFGAAELALMKPTALFVNVGRGSVVDERALYEALRDQRIRAAAIDVWWRYPENYGTRVGAPPSAYPFYDLPNVVLSPHRAGMGGADELERVRVRHLAALLNAGAREGVAAMPNRVDMAVGY
jgi:phosphoglycerate dehydrogenase-like enzyme